MARLHMGMALAALGRRAEAETLLLIAGLPKLPPRSASTSRAVRFLVDFYDDWNRAQPDADPRRPGHRVAPTTCVYLADRPTLVPSGSSGAASAPILVREAVRRGRHRRRPQRPVCAAYLARAGRKTLVLERRHVLGGAAVTEEICPRASSSRSAATSCRCCGPRSSATSSCRSTASRSCRSTARSRRCRERRLPVARQRPRRRRAASSPRSPSDAEAYEEYGQLMVEMAPVHQADPGDGAARPDVARPARRCSSSSASAARFRGLRHATASDQFVQLMTMSARGLPRPVVRDRAAQGDDVARRASSARSRACARRARPTCCCTTTWARSTARSARGASRRAAPARSSNAIASAARALGAEIRTEAPVARILTRGRPRDRRRARERRGDRAPTSCVSSVDPRLTFLEPARAEACSTRRLRGEACAATSSAARRAR